MLLADISRRASRTYPVYIRAGLKWERAEIAVLRRFIARLGNRKIAPLKVLAMPVSDIDDAHWAVSGRRVPGYRASVVSNYLPGRNLTLLTKAAMFCARERISEIAMAPLESNPFPDARPEFFRAFERAAELGLALKIRVTTPFLGMTKSDVIRRGRALPLVLTLSCANPHGTVHCGACTKCAERIEAFAAAGVPDPTRYATRSRTTSRATFK